MRRFQLYRRGLTISLILLKSNSRSKKDNNTYGKIRLSTHYFRSDYVSSTRFPKKLNIMIDGKISLTNDKICVFLNELPSFNILQHSTSHSKTKDSSEKTTFYFVYLFNKKYRFQVEITDTISLKISTDWILKEWTQENAEILSFIGADNKELAKPQKQPHVRYIFDIDQISDSSRYFIKKRD